MATQCAHRCRPRALCMHRCSKLTQTSRLVTTQDAQLHGEVQKSNSWTCKPAVGARQGMNE
eukprot:1153447-Pelagomonas_calceolata.AAC.6